MTTCGYKIKLLDEYERINTTLKSESFPQCIEKQYDELLPSWSHSSGKENLVQAPLKDNLVSAALLAWNEHKGLKLAPDHFWNAIMRAFSSYLNVDGNAEKYRQYFVKHEGKIELVVNMDDVLLNKTSWTEFGEIWIRRIIEKLSQNVPEDVVAATVAEFSTSTELSQTCNRLCTMKAMSNYFVYVCATRCCLPMVFLEGDESDWEQLIEKTNALQQLCFDAGMELDWYFEDIKEPLQNLLSTFQTAKNKTSLSEDLSQWWQQIINKNIPGVSGCVTYNGWITKFIAFTSQNRKRGFYLTADCFSCSYVCGDFIRRHNGRDAKHAYVGGVIGVEYIQDPSESEQVIDVTVHDKGDLFILLITLGRKRFLPTGIWVVSRREERSIQS